MGHYCYDTRHWVVDEIDPSITDWDGTTGPDRGKPQSAHRLLLVPAVMRGPIAINAPGPAIAHERRAG